MKDENLLREKLLDIICFSTPSNAVEQIVKLIYDINLTPEEQIIFEVIVAAREVQDFLWQDMSLQYQDFQNSFQIWLDVFQKRVVKISQIDFNNPSAKVELRKRILQQAALSIQALKVLSNEGDNTK